MELVSSTAFMYTSSVENVAHMSSSVLGSWISKWRKFSVKDKIHHLGKFAPRETNLLLGKAMCEMCVDQLRMVAFSSSTY